MKALKGSEKQIKWAEDIREMYSEKMGEYRAWLEAVAETGSTKEADRPLAAEEFVRHYSADALYESVEESGKFDDLKKAYRALERKTPERKEAYRAYVKAIAGEAVKKLDAAVADQMEVESSAEWIENRPR